MRSGCSGLRAVVGWRGRFDVISVVSVGVVWCRLVLLSVCIGVRSVVRGLYICVPNRCQSKSFDQWGCEARESVGNWSGPLSMVKKPELELSSTKLSRVAASSSSYSMWWKGGSDFRPEPFSPKHTGISRLRYRECWVESMDASGGSQSGCHRTVPNAVGAFLWRGRSLRSHLVCHSVRQHQWARALPQAPSSLAAFRSDSMASVARQAGQNRSLLYCPTLGKSSE